MSGRAAIYNHMNLNRFLLDSAFALWLPEPGPNAAKSSVSSDKTVGSERPKLHSDSADQHWPGTVSFGSEISLTEHTVVSHTRPIRRIRTFPVSTFWDDGFHHASTPTS